MELAFAGRLFAACVAIAALLSAATPALRLRRHLPRAFSGGGRLMTVVETAALPGATSLHLVRVAERYLVVGRGAGGLSLLCELPDAAFARPDA